METNQLLIVAYHFPPSAASGVFRLLGFVRHLPKFGWQTSVVAPPRIPWEPSDPSLLKSVPDDTPVQYAPYPSGRLWKPFQRLVGGYASWLPPGLLACFKSVHQNHPTTILTSGPPHCVHFLGYALKRLYRLPWVADFRDPWVANLTPVWSQRWSARAERFIIRNADLVIANAPRATDAFATAYPKYASKIVTVTNGFDAPPPISLPPLNGPLEILHTGELYAGRDPRPYLDAVRLLRDASANSAPGFRTCLVGRIAPKSVAGFDLIQEIQSRGLTDTVELRDQVSYNEALSQMQRAGALLLLDTPGRRTGVPAKLYEYFGAARPILALTEPDGDVAAVLKQSSVLHRIAAPRDVPAICRGLTELTASIRTNQPAVQEPTALLRFTRESLAQELAGHLDLINIR